MSAAPSQIRALPNTVSHKPSSDIAPDAILTEPNIGQVRRLLRFLRCGAWEVTRTIHDRPGSDQVTRWTPQQVMAAVIPTVGLIIVISGQLMGFFGDDHAKIKVLENEQANYRREMERKDKEIEALTRKVDVVSGVAGIDPASLQRMADALKRGQQLPAPDPSR